MRFGRTRTIGTMAAIASLAAGGLAGFGPAASAGTATGAGAAGAAVDVEQAVAPANTPINVQMLNISDLHGYIRPHGGGNGTIVDGEGRTIVVGGGAYLSAHLERLSQGQRNSFRFTSGDSFSGWPEEIAWHRDEPTIEFFNHIGLDFNNVGNHEFDVSEEFLVDHMWKGKCFGEVDVDSCFTDSAGDRFGGSDFPHSTANIVERDSERLLTPPVLVRSVSNGAGQRIPVGFINLTTEAGVTETMSYQPHLKALPLVETADRYARTLQRAGVEAIVVSVHEGGTHDGHFDNCVNPRGPIIDFARQASPAIDAIFTGHWHAAFNCAIDDPAGNPRPVVEAGAHGKLLNETNLRIDPRTKDVIRAETTSVNHPVTRDIEPDPVVSRMVDYWVDKAAETGARSVAEIDGDLDREMDDSGESTLGNAAVDAMHGDSRRNAPDPADFAIAATRTHYGSVAFNQPLTYEAGSDPGDADGRVLFSEWRRSFGYGNPVVTATVTGQAIHDALEGQWQATADGESFAPLAVSSNVHYSWSAGTPIGDRVDPADVTIDGQPLDVNGEYRIAALTYTLYGRDGTAGLTDFTDPFHGTVDRDAFLDYLDRNTPLTPPNLDRVDVTD